jgi:hypothetical protein
MDKGVYRYGAAMTSGFAVGGRDRCVSGALMRAVVGLRWSQRNYGELSCHGRQARRLAQATDRDGLHTASNARDFCRARFPISPLNR